MNLASLQQLAKNKVSVACACVLAMVMYTLFTPVPQAFGAADAGANVARDSAGGVATSSGVEVQGKWGADQVIDGDQTTSTSRWSSNTADDAWIQVKLAAPTVIDHVNIYWETACSPNYQILVSTDGNDWHEGAVVDRSADCLNENTNGTNAQKVTSTLKSDIAGSAWQYVRMQGNGRVTFGGQKWGMSLYEFEVWDGPEDTLAPNTASDDLDLIPLPASLTQDENQPDFELTPDTVITSDAASSDVAQLFAHQLRASTGFDLPVAADGSITLTVDPALDMAGLDSQFLDEAYALDVTADGVTITGRTAHGVWNGTRTLMQLFPAFIYSDSVVNADWRAPAVHIKDAPRFSYRSIQLDPSRSFLTVDEIKKFIDTWANVKGSSLHWHLSDDQGWRIEITNEGREAGDTIDYTLLTQKGGATAMNGNLVEGKGSGGGRVGSYLPIQGSELDEIGHTGYYTQAEFLEVQEYAKARFVNIVPEIDMPAHTMAALASIPQLNSPGSSHDGTYCTDECGDTRQEITDPSQWITADPQANGNVGDSYLDPDSKWTGYFMRHVFKQIAELTDGEYIHVGGDESHMMTAQHGIEYFNRYLTLSTQTIRDLGKTPMGWNEIASNTLQAGDVVQYWTGSTSNTVRAVNQEGAKVVVSAANNSYIDMHYGAPGGNILGLTWAGTGDFDKYYNWNPANVAAGVPESAVIGTDAPQWSETIRGGYQAEWLAWPRAISHSEVAWTPQALRNVDDFKVRMSGMGDRLTAMHVNFYDGAKAKWDTSLAGTDVQSSPGLNVTLPIGKFIAPGTAVSVDGASISVVGGGRSASALSGAYSATVDWGDGTPAEQVTFGQFDENPQGGLYRTGIYTVLGEHNYANAGNYRGTITGSDGSTANFEVTVAEGLQAPSYHTVGVVAESPSVTLAKTSGISAPERVELKIAGFNPKEYVKISWGEDDLFLVLTDINGEATYSMPFVKSMKGGTQTLRAESAVGDQGEPVAAEDAKSAHTTATLELPEVRDFSEPLQNLIDRSAYSVVTASSDTTQETLPSGPTDAAIDGSVDSFWHTDWNENAYPLPHFITIKLNQPYQVSGLEYTSRQQGTNGRAKAFKVYVSDAAPTVTKESLAALPSGTDRKAAVEEAMAAGGFGTLADCGMFGDVQTALAVNFEEPIEGQYVTLVEVSTLAGNGFGGAAEIRIGGTVAEDVPSADPTEVTPRAPSWDEATRSYTITPVDGVVYKVDGHVVTGTLQITGTEATTVRVTAELASKDYVFAEGAITSFSHDFPQVEQAEPQPGESEESEVSVEAVSPSVSDPGSCTVKPYVLLPQTAGVQYEVNGVATPSGKYEYGYGETITITAVALDGYQLSQPGWSVKFQSASLESLTCTGSSVAEVELPGVDTNAVTPHSTEMNMLGQSAIHSMPQTGGRIWLIAFTALTLMGLGAALFTARRERL